MKALITGAAGQLGQSLQDLIASEDCIPLTSRQLDITKPDEISAAIQKYEPSLLINAAAYNHVDQAEVDQERAFEVNERGPFHLANCCAEKDIPIVHVSTDYVFDGKKDNPYLEDDATNPLGVYGRSKLAGEQAVLNANPKSYVVRTAWVYHEGGNNFYKKMLELSFMKKGLRVNHDQTGSPTYAPHLAEGILKLVETEKYGICHLAGSKQATRYQMVERLFQYLGIKTPIEPAASSDFPTKAERPLYSVLGTAHPSKILLPSWEDGVKEFAENLGDPT